ncbi:MAG TPA: TIGR01212 family radical SAM protein [Bacteroidales bacterium]|nr:TIGR01212 family radical SAM protein [Bacteroidales bacterium]HPT02084.1 TIGR01212 family radical SAM protein [Bacteroidales bacterium]
MSAIIYPWGHQKRFNSYSEYFRRTFGHRVQKVAIDAGFTCPNRDGHKGYGGCIYCNNNAFNPSYCQPQKSITQQISEGIGFHRVRYRRAANYLAYFQAYSNTYASLPELKRRYEEALSYPGVIGLVIGTRPDCIDDEKLEYLAGLARKYYIIVEYGVESCFNQTLEKINRRHTFSESVTAIRKTSEYGIHTGAHIIFGLPGETEEDMLSEAEILSLLPLNTIKFHQLQIIRNTLLEKEYLQNPERFNLFPLDEYIDFIIRFIERLNPAFVIERFSGEAPPRFQSGQVWGNLRTDQVQKLIENELEKRDTWQGKLYNCQA